MHTRTRTAAAVVPVVLLGLAALLAGAPATARPAASATMAGAAAPAMAPGAVPAMAPAAVPAMAPAAAGQPRLGACGAGQLCLWPKSDFRGRASTHELADTDIESCVALPAGTSAQALANRTGRPVTTYQSAECAETGQFETYPGTGTWVPQSPYQVRAFKLWER